MKLLEDKIIREGKVLPGDILKVDNFVNHQIDTKLYQKLGKEFYRLFKKEKPTKILTIEASGIAIACHTAMYFGIPVVFAKKSKSSNISDNFYHSVIHSYTHGNDYTATVDCDYLSKDDRVLILDDFLATGSAFAGMYDIVSQSGAKVIGVGAIVEKFYQPGRSVVEKLGVKVHSLACVKSMDDSGKIEFVHFDD